MEGENRARKARARQTIAHTAQPRMMQHHRNHMLRLICYMKQKKVLVLMKIKYADGQLGENNPSMVLSGAKSVRIGQGREHRAYAR